MGFTVEGFSPKPGESASSLVNAVSPGYLEALQARIVRGRAFTVQDARMPPEGEEWPYRTGIVNETFVKRYFGDRDPIGRHVGIGDDPGTAMPIAIVGVVADSKYQAIREERESADPPAGVREPRPEQRHRLPPQPRSRRHRSWPTCAASSGARSGPAGVQRGDARRTRRPLAPQRAAGGGPVGRVRDARDASRRRRALRRDGLHRHAALARDRHPDGARRARLARRPACRARGGPARRRGPGARGAGWRGGSSATSPPSSTASRPAIRRPSRSPRSA